eukprot:m51a1_g5061 hypothetical protein (125) ;mRNA; r:114690-115784
MKERCIVLDPPSTQRCLCGALYDVAQLYPAAPSVFDVAMSPVRMDRADCVSVVPVGRVAGLGESPLCAATGLLGAIYGAVADARSQQHHVVFGRVVERLGLRLPGAGPSTAEGDQRTPSPVAVF